MFCSMKIFNGSYRTIVIEGGLDLSGSGRDQKSVIVSKYGTEPFIFIRF